MTHSVRETGAWQHTVSIEVPVDDVHVEIEAVAREVQRRAVLPGFRKGRVPLDRVRTQFADSIEREFLDRFIPRITQHALAESGLNPVVPPMVQNLRFTPGQPLTFDAVVEVAPRVDVREHRGLDLVRRPRPVSDERVEAALAGLREESAVFTDLARPARAGDIVLVDSQRIDPNGRRLAGSLAKGVRIQLGSPQLLPDLERGLAGAERGQERTLTVEYPADYAGNANLAGQTVRYVVKIRKIQEKKLRELDDNFARDLFGLDSLAALRDRVRHNLEAEEAARERRELEGAVVEELIRRNPFDLPGRMVEYVLHRVVHEQAERRELRPELHRQLEQHYRPGVERSLRREVLLAAVARQENLDVTEDEIAAEISRIAASDSRQAARVRAHYQSAERRRALADTILERKAYDWIISQASVREQPLAEAAPVAG